MDAKEKLQQHLDELFTAAGAPTSRAANELREELLANSLARYEDLVASGMDDDSAFASVASNIGNIDELVAALPADVQMVELNLLREKNRQRIAIIVAISVGLYILAGLVMVIGQFFTSWIYPFAGGIALCIIPTCLLVYNSIANPQYKKGDDTIVESFKEFSANNGRSKAVRGSLSVILWMLVLVAYFIISFATGAWYITWVIFLIGGCLEAALTLVFNLKGTK